MVRNILILGGCVWGLGVLCAPIHVSHAGWLSDLQDGNYNPQTDPKHKHKKSSLDKEFKVKAFSSKKYNQAGKNLYFQKKYKPKEAKFLKDDQYFSRKSFRSKGSSFFSKKSPFQANDLLEYEEAKFKNAKGSPIKGFQAREGGKVAEFQGKAFSQSRKFYKGAEAQKVKEEMKIINETLKNKEDLKSHRLSIQEINKILNENK